MPVTINELLKIAVDRKASDLHLKVGNHPIVRVDGHLIPVEEQPKLTIDRTVGRSSFVRCQRNA